MPAPISPHLQIYRLPLTALFSISHRITGVILSIGVALLVAILVVIASDPPAYTAIQGMLKTFLGQSALFLWILALYFHLCHGIRHLLWDMDIGFSDKANKLANLLTMAMAPLLTIVTWVIAN